MAIRSVTINPVKLYQYAYLKSTGRYVVAELSSDSFSIHYLYGEALSQWLLAEIADMSSTLGSYALVRAEGRWRVSSTDTSMIYYNRALSGPFDSSPTPKPESGAYGPPYHIVSAADPAPGHNVYLDTYNEAATANNKAYTAYMMLKNRAVLLEAPVSGTKTAVAYTTLENGTPPQIIIYYDDSNPVPCEIGSITGMTSGYRNPRSELSVSWTLRRKSDADYYCLDGFETASATLYWRETGDTNWNSISAASGASSISIPANTFPAESSIEWYVSVTDTHNYTATSLTYTFSTTDGAAVATPLLPAGMMVNGGIDNEFTWSVTNTTGQPQTRTVGYWATDPDAVSWNTLFDLSTNAMSYVVPAGTLTGGTIYWKVQAYNQDSEAGPMSSPVSISVVAPPAAPSGVAASQVPFSTISWQSDGQRAYEISVDGTVVKKSFGADVYSYKLSEPLSHGQHTISVRIQGVYGLWSAQSSTVCNIVNSPDAELILSGQFDVDAELTWTRTPINDGQSYWIYRDGRRIGHNDEGEFIDRFVLGEHSYYIIEELTNGNYNRSQTITGMMKSCITRISQIDGFAWLDLPLSENSNSKQSFSWSKPVTLRHVSGAAYPIAELSAFEDRSAVYDCAFSDVASGRELEAMRGKTVIIKSRGGEVVIGPLTTIEKVTGDFYIVYRFTIQQIHWEDFVDDADS